MVDKGPLGRIRELLALATAAFLGGTGLVVDQYGTAGDITQFPLHLVELGPIVEGDVLGKQVMMAIVFLGLVAENNNPIDPFCGHLLGNPVDGDLPVDGLTAGHGDGVIEQNLVGNIDAGSYRLTDSHGTGVEIRAFTQVLEHVGVAGVAALANPVDAFATHLDEGFGVPAHPGRHEVTANAGQGLAPLRDLGGGVVWAARAEIGHTLDAARILGVGHGTDFSHALAEVHLEEATKTGCEEAGNQFGAQFANVRDQRAAQLILFADNQNLAGTVRLGHVLLDLALDNAALFLDHEDFFLAVHEVQDAAALQGPDHAHLVDIQTHVPGLVFVNTEQIEGFQQVKVPLAGGDNTKAGFLIVEQAPVNAVGPGKGLNGRELVFDAGFQLGAGQIRPAVMKAAFRRGEIVRSDKIRCWRNFHRSRAFHGFRYGLEADPAATVAGKGITPETEFQVFRDVGRVDGGHEEAHECHIGLVGHGR